MADALSHDWYIDQTLTEIARLASVAEGADPAAPVPTCPGWTMAKLVKHTGSAHRWATQIVATRAAEPVDGRSLDLGLPDKESEYPGWLAAGGERLAAVLHEAGPDTAAWAWGPDQTSGFWARRMLHETVVHRADAEIATGKVPEIDAVTAADAIDEFLANLPAMLVMRNRELPAGESLHLHATDGDGEWLIRFTADGIETSRDHAKATTALRAPTDRLLLFTYGRIKPDDESLTVFGDEALAATWQEKTAL